MEETTTTENPDSRASENLVRPVQGRMIAGVAAAIAFRFGLNPNLVRILFVALSFAGGAGVVLYLAGWFLTRSEDRAESPAERLFSGAGDAGSWIGIGIVFVAVLLVLGGFRFISGRMVWAVALLVLGVLLYTGDLARFVARGQADGPPPGGDGPPRPETAAATSIEGATTLLDPPSSGGTVGGGLPPTPTPTPPILPPAPMRPRERSILGRLTIGAVLVGLGILALLDNIPGLALEPEPRHYVALGVTILGLGLIVGAFAGRARWLIIVGVLVVPTMLFSPIFEYDWNADNFESSVMPSSFQSLQDEYSLDVGDLRIDLTELPWNGEQIELDASVDAGNIQIWLPEGVGLTGTATADVGRVAGFGQQSSGLGEPTLEWDVAGTRGSVALDARVDIGNIEIFHG